MRNRVPLVQVVYRCVFAALERGILASDDFIDPCEVPRDRLGEIAQVNCVVLGLHTDQILLLLRQVLLALDQRLFVVEARVDLNDSRLAASWLVAAAVRVLDHLLEV